MGGTGALVDALVRLFVQLGGEIRYETPARAIEVDPVSGRARSVEVENGERIVADAVVSNADVALTYRRLVSVDRASREHRSSARQDAILDVAVRDLFRYGSAIR